MGANSRLGAYSNKYGMTKFDQLQASLARVGLIDLLLLIKTNDGVFLTLNLVEQNY